MKQIVIFPYIYLNEDLSLQLAIPHIYSATQNLNHHFIYDLTATFVILLLLLLTTFLILPISFFSFLTTRK